MDLSYGRSPFPFSDRPVLPHIDAFQDNQKLKLIRDEREHPLSSTKVKKSCNLDNDTKYGYYTVKDIKLVFQFIKNNKDNENYGFTLDELELAFRKVKRAIKYRDEEYYARRLMNTFEFLLKIKNLTPKQWFKLVDTSQANKGDGKLTWLEFETGMNNLCTDLGAALFTKHDLIVMLKYLDPNGDGDLSYHEVTKGFARIHQVADCKTIMLKSGPIIPYLQDFMRERQIRVRDLFNFLDIKNKKSVTLEVFCEGIERVASFISPESDDQQLDSEQQQQQHSQHSQRFIDDEEEETQPLTLHIPSSPTLNNSSTSPPKSSDSNFMKQKLHRELLNRSKIHLPPVKTRSGGAAGGAGQQLDSNSLLHSSSLSTTSPPSHFNSSFHGHHQHSISQHSSSQRGYERQVKKQFREYDEWLKQFDRKLQNGLILMSKM